MGLEFNFDEISLEQKVSREQLEIDLYDELVTISDAEPEEQVRLLAVKPAVAISQQDDKPESIRVTGSLGKEHSLAGATVSPSPIAAEKTETPIAARPAIVAKPEPLPSAVAGGPPVTPAPPNGQKSNPIQPPGPSPRTKELHPLPRVQALTVAPAKNPEPPVQLPAAPARLPTAPAEAPAGACPDCGKPAGELDMICIECGALIG